MLLTAVVGNTFILLSWIIFVYFCGELHVRMCEKATKRMLNVYTYTSWNIDHPRKENQNDLRFFLKYMHVKQQVKSLYIVW